jgi:hypothetical protein
MIEFIERIITFSIKLTAFMYITSTLYDGLAYSTYIGAMSYGVIEAMYYSATACYALMNLNIDIVMTVGLSMLLLSLLIISYIKNIYLIFLSFILIGFGAGMIKSVAIHVLSLLYKDFSVRMIKLKKYYVIINIGSLTGGLVFGILTQNFGWLFIYKHILVAYAMIYIFLMSNMHKIIDFRRKYIDEISYNFIDKEDSDTDGLDRGKSKIFNLQYETILSIFKRNKLSLLYLFTSIMLGSLNICFTCNVMMNYNSYIGQRIINFYGYSLPITTIINFNPLIVIIVSSCGIKMNSKINFVKHFTQIGLLYSFFAYLLYIVTLNTQYTLSLSIISIILIAISETYLVVCTYNSIVSVFNNASPRSLVKIISTCYFSMGLSSILLSVLSDYFIYSNLYHILVVFLMCINMFSLSLGMLIKK